MNTSFIPASVQELVVNLFPGSVPEIDSLISNFDLELVSVCK